MRQLCLLLLSIVVLRLAWAIPREPLYERQGLLDPLESYVSSVLEIEPTPTPPTSSDPNDGPAKPTPKPRPSHTNHDNGDDEPTTLDAPAIRTSSSSSSVSTSTVTSSSTSSRSTITSSSSAPPVPTNPLNSASTPAPAKKASGSTVTPAGIAVAIIMGFAVLIAIFIVVWKFHPKVVAWRKKKAYERMQERTYRPALDGPLPKNSSREKGLGLRNIDEQEAQRPLSFFAFAAPKVHKTIRRKPVPKRDYPVEEMPKLEKDLPPTPDRLAQSLG